MTDVLTKTDLSSAQKALFDLSRAEDIVSKMKKIGLECEEHDQRCQHYRGILEGILSEFGDGASPKGQRTK